MKLQTIEFIRCLSEYSDCGPQLFERLREELISDGKQRFSSYLRKDICFLSGKGKSFNALIREWMNGVSEMSDIGEAAVLARQLIDLAARGDYLRKEALNALHNPGWLDPDKLHFVYRDEIEEAFSRIRDAIKLEMYRIVTTDVIRFSHLPKLASVPLRLQNYYDYYAGKVIPVLRNIPEGNRYGYWAYTLCTDRRFGKLGTMSYFLAKPPTFPCNRLFPGEHRCMKSGGERTWVGRGHLTNITPETVYRALEEGIVDYIPADKLRDETGESDPDIVLKRELPGRWYAIPADSYFSQMTMNLIMQTVNARLQNQRCMYCGNPARYTGLCGPCAEKIVRGLL